jgi:HAD superfamily hydrolase (TIGR01509 family)
VGVPAVCAAIFDLDGLLIDSEPLWRRAEREIFAEVGLVLTDDDCRTTIGMRCDAVVAHWYARSPWRGPSTKHVQQQIEDRMLTLLSSEGRAMPGVEHALGVLKKQRIPLAVASSSTIEHIDAALERIGAGQRIGVRRSSMDEVHGKPHPAVYLAAARRLGIAPEHCLAFEDSLLGVEAAHRAGMRVVAVPDASEESPTSFGHADIVLRSLAELTVELIRAIDYARRPRA